SRESACALSTQTTQKPAHCACMSSTGRRNRAEEPGKGPVWRKDVSIAPGRRVHAPELLGSQSGKCLELPAESAVVAIATAQRNLRDRNIILDQQPGRMFNAILVDHPKRCQLVYALAVALQLRDRQFGDFGQLGKCDLTIEVPAYVFVNGCHFRIGRMLRI